MKLIVMNTMLEKFHVLHTACFLATSLFLNLLIYFPLIAIYGILNNFQYNLDDWLLF